MWGTGRLPGLQIAKFNVYEMRWNQTWLELGTGLGIIVGSTLIEPEYFSLVR